MLLAVPIMFGLGYLVQLTLLNKLTLSGSHEGPLLVTLGLSLLIVNVLLMIFSGRPKSVGTAVDGSLRVLGALLSWERIIAFVGAVAVTVALTVILRRTSFGLSIRAVASNPSGAALVGVNVGRVYALTFGIGAACVAVAGRPDGTAGQPHARRSARSSRSWPSSSSCSEASATSSAPWSAAC